MTKVIGSISKPSCVFVRQRSFARRDVVQYFLDGYRETVGLVGVGLRILPIIVVGAWPFPGAGKKGLERRCLITQGDGSDNDAIYQSVLALCPNIAHLCDDVIMAFIPEGMMERAPPGKMGTIGQLSACFDIASWFVDTLPFITSQGVYDLTRRDVKALALGIFTNILITRLCVMGVVPAKQLTQMRITICGVVMEKMASCKASARPAVFEGEAETSPLSHVTHQHMQARPGMMTRLLQTLTSVPDAEFMQDLRDPDPVFQKILIQSLRYFQRP